MGKYALLIANSDYRDERLNGLTAPSADVYEFKSVLDDKTIGAFDDVKVVSNADLVRSQREIKSFLDDRNSDDLALIYFTGHGLVDSDGKLWLAMAESSPDPDAAEIGSYEAAKLTRALDKCAALRQLLILDCCHSGAIDTNLTGGMAKPKSGSIRPAISKSTFGSKAAGRYILASSSATQLSYEISSRSQFTKAMVEGLRSGAAAPESEAITFGDLANYIAQQLKLANVPMTPFIVPDKKEAQRLEICKNPNPLRSLPESVVKALNDESDIERRLGAITRIYAFLQTEQSSGSNQAIESVLNKRLQVEEHVAVHSELSRLRAKIAGARDRGEISIDAPSKASAIHRENVSVSSPLLVNDAMVSKANIAIFIAAALMTGIPVYLFGAKAAGLLETDDGAAKALLGTLASLIGLPLAAVVSGIKSIKSIALMSFAWLVGLLAFAVLWSFGQSLGPGTDLGSSFLLLVFPLAYCVPLAVVAVFHSEFARLKLFGIVYLGGLATFFIVAALSYILNNDNIPGEAMIVMVNLPVFACLGFCMWRLTLNSSRVPGAAAAPVRDAGRAGARD